MAVVLVVDGAVARRCASAVKPPVEVRTTYVALGDSLAFGYSQQLFNECEKLGETPSCFENGYVNDFYKTTKGAQNGEQLINQGCPGEAPSG